MASHMLPAHPELPEPTPPDLALVDSFNLHLRAEGKSTNTVSVYTLAARLLARWTAGTGRRGLDSLTPNDVKAYLVWMRETARKRDGNPYAPGYVNNQYRAIQQFFRWLAAEEDVPTPMGGMRPPKVGTRVTPVLDDEQIADLLKTAAKGKDHDARRDYAILRLFLCSGIRLAELTNLTTASIDLPGSRATVIGKGDRQRIVRFDLKTASAIDRYLRVRAKHKLAADERIWLGSNHRPPLTANGVRQVITRRAASVGLKINPHRFRHTFSHRWLDAGGPEGDLMELNGWTSPQMLRHYGASARSARAQRAYDRIDVMGGM